MHRKNGRLLVNCAPQSPRENHSTHPARPVMRRRRTSGTWRGTSTPRWGKRYVPKWRNHFYDIVNVSVHIYAINYHLFNLRNFPRQVQRTTVRFHVFTDISSQCWQCKEVQGGDGSRQGRGGWIWLHYKWVWRLLCNSGLHVSFMLCVMHLHVNPFPFSCMCVSKVTHSDLWLVTSNQNFMV